MKLSEFLGEVYEIIVNYMRSLVTGEHKVRKRRGGPGNFDKDKAWQVFLVTQLSKTGT